MDERIPESVRPVLERYLSLIDAQLPGLMRAFYVVGSIALGGYNERFSDIDFVSIFEHPVSRSQLESLRTTHETIEKEFPKSKLSGSYVQENDLGRFEHEMPPHPYYQDGKLHEQGYFEINSITWWVLKNHGIAIRGMEPQELPFTVDWDLLISKMKENLNSYWKSWTTRPDAFWVMLSDWGIQWTILGVLRQYYTFQENSITTKLGAGEYALNHLPQRWHPLIREAMDIREGCQKQHYYSRIIRMLDAVKFMKYLIRISN
jgi:hypothetical protein